LHNPKLAFHFALHQFYLASMGSIGQRIGKHMTSKAREYQAKAAQYEEQARKIRIPRDREWHLVIARAYRKLAEMETKLAAQREVAAA
jgi:hypothetical protein